jgi:hypothetical protein
MVILQIQNQDEEELKQKRMLQIKELLIVLKILLRMQKHDLENL